MGSGKNRWKLSFHRSSPSSPTTPPPLPVEFVCPISGSLMADPVILTSGQTFERNCIQACLDLDLTPPSTDLSFSPSPSPLIPNAALKAAILHFCDSSAVPRPLPVSPDDARDFVRRFVTPSTAAAAEEESTTPTTPPLFIPTNFSPPSTSSSSYRSNFSTSSSDLITAAASDETLTLKIPNHQPDPDSAVDYMEEEILAKLKEPEISEQAAALARLRRATRESHDRRISLCSPRLLSAVRPMLLSRYSAVQIDAAASMVNLSLETPNKVRIVRSGMVPPLVTVLKSGHPEARDHAAGALFSLALHDDNKAAIGVLGGIPPLIHLFAGSNPGDAAPLRSRRDAGMALYHLTLVRTNRSKLTRTPGAVRALMGVAAEVSALAKLALMVVCNLAGSSEGRAALMDGGAVEGVVGLLKSGTAATEEEHCVAALYGMSRGSLRFRGLAKAAEAEAVLMGVAVGGGGEVRREMARRTVSAMRGEVEEDGESIVSDGLVSFRRRYNDFRDASGANSAEF